MSKLVSILIPTHQSALTIRAAIISCFNQSYENIEIIVLDSSSTDHTKEVIESLKRDNVFFHITNQNGIAAARNELLRLAKGEFIAWLDADDIMLPNRIENQIQHFEQHPEIDILGSWIYTDSDELPTKELPTTHDEISTCLWFKNCMIQPSIMSRNFYVREGIFYDENYNNSAEDYELWYRLKDTKRFANIPKYLTLYHITTGAELEIKKEHNQFKTHIQLLWQKKWEDQPISVDQENKSTFIEFLYNNFCPNNLQIQQLQTVLNALKEINTNKFFRLIIQYHELRLWRNMSWLNRIRHLNYTTRLSKWFEFKKHQLI